MAVSRTARACVVISTLLLFTSLNLYGYFSELPIPFGRDLAQTEHGTSSSHDSVDRDFHVLPKRLITVLGLESSGTRFLANTLAQAVGAAPSDIIPGFLHSNNSTVVLHVSQPFGFWRSSQKSLPNITDFIPPIECTKWPHAEDMGPPSPYCANETGLVDRVRMPQRLLLNVTSHILWYKNRGVDATAVIIVRDDYAHFQNKIHIHQNDEDLALKEDLIAKELFVEAFARLSPSEIALVSYETLMSLQTPVLFGLYKQLGIQSSFVPEFSNGNKKYIQDPKGGAAWRVDPGERHDFKGENESIIHPLEF